MKQDDRSRVYNKYTGHCAYCGKIMEYKDMQVDHIQPKSFHGKAEFENYNPSCRLCNHYKRAMLLETFRLYMKTLHERVEKIYIVRVAIKHGMLELEPFDGEFYFEKIERTQDFPRPKRVYLQKEEEVEEC